MSERGGKPATDAVERSTAKKTVTMEMVGRIAGVSQVTVSRALNDPTKVSPATLKKIRDAIEVTGFVPNALAGALASRRSRLVSALVPSVMNIVYASMVHSFSEGMRAKGYQIMLSETGLDPIDEERVIETHLSRRPDGMFLTGTHHTANARRMLLAAKIPTVEAWDLTETPIDICVGFSHAAAGVAAARFVREAGFERAACITAIDERALRRKTAFAESFTAMTGLAVPTVEVEAGASLGGGRAALAELLDRHGFDRGAIFCSSDVLAHGVLTEARRRNIEVPSRIGVVGFGDQGFAADTFPALTTVRVDRAILGTRAAEAILGRLGDGGEVIAVNDIGFEIVRRESA